MSWFVPDFAFATYRDISPEFLSGIGVKALLIDIDNTLAPYEQQGSKQYGKYSLHTPLQIYIMVNPIHHQYLCCYGIVGDCKVIFILFACLPLGWDITRKVTKFDVANSILGISLLDILQVERHRSLIDGLW